MSVEISSKGVPYEPPTPSQHATPRGWVRNLLTNTDERLNPHRRAGGRPLGNPTMSLALCASGGGCHSSGGSMWNPNHIHHSLFGETKRSVCSIEPRIEVCFPPGTHEDSLRRGVAAA